MGKRVLVTGGAGYVGSVLCEHLLSAGYEVTVLDNVLYGQTSLFHHCHNPNFRFVFGDARDEQLLGKLARDVDILIPLAAIVGAPACDRDPQMARGVNFEAISMLNRIRRDSQKIIYPNTNSGYGTTSGDLYCDEESPLEPISLYGKTKVEAEQELLHTGNAVVLRLATVFGMSPRMRLDLLVNHFVYTAVTDGYLVIFEKDFKRNYVHVRDVADCFLHCIQNYNNMCGKPYNVGLEEANLSKEELALKVKEHVPSFYIHYSEIGTDVDKRNYIVSNKRLLEAGFRARRTIDEGISELLKGYAMLKRHPMKNV